MVEYLKPGQEIKFNNPPAAGGYREYKMTELQGIMAGIGLPYELGTGDMSQVPAPMTWHEMQSPSLTLTINGVDYVASKNFVSLDMGWGPASSPASRYKTAMRRRAASKSATAWRRLPTWRVTSMARPNWRRLALTTGSRDRLPPHLPIGYKIRYSDRLASRLSDDFAGET